MQFTPNQAAAHLKESITSYIESQYRISHPLVFEERRHCCESVASSHKTHSSKRLRRLHRSPAP